MVLKLLIMKKKLSFLIIPSLILLGSVAFLNPGGSQVKTGGPAAEGTDVLNDNLTAQQEKKDYGIGPIKEVKLGPVDVKMAQKGHDLFNNKCLLCHDLDQKKIGPPIRNITKTRTPEYIMNLLLNTVQMQKEDPVVKDLITIYKVPMTPPDFTPEQARSVLEYLRSVTK